MVCCTHEKQDAPHTVKHMSLPVYRAQRERLDIQKRDLHFKKDHNRWFCVFKQQHRTITCMEATDNCMQQ